MLRLTEYFSRTKFKWLNLGLLILIFTISIFVRSRHFGLPMERHHEWLTAHTLVILDNWEQNGLANYYFSPIYSYNNPGDTDDYSICTLHDKRGNAYYVSYGPLAPLLPYLVFKTLQLPITANSLVGFNLFIHFLTSFFLYLLVIEITKKKFGQFSIAAVATFTFYVFSPGTLWFHGNIYFNEILAQLLVAAGLYLFYRIISREEISKRMMIGYSIICFLCVYNDWFGLLFVFFAGIVLLVKSFYNRKYLKPFFFGSAAGIAALMLIVFQYSQIDGYERLKEVSLNKFTERNGGSLMSTVKEKEFSVQNSEAFTRIERYINENFINVINSLAFIIALFIFIIYLDRKALRQRNNYLLIFILLLSVFFHHYLFFNFTSLHDFSVLKTGLFLIVLAGVLMAIIETVIERNIHMRQAYMLLLSGLVFVKSFESVKHLHSNNNPGTIDVSYYNMGNSIRKLAKPDERVFTNIYLCPIINYYAKRNVQYSLNGNEARTFAMMYNLKTIFFKLDKGECSYFTRYFSNGDSIRVNLKGPINENDYKMIKDLFVGKQNASDSTLIKDDVDYGPGMDVSLNDHQDAQLLVAKVSVEFKPVPQKPLPDLVLVQTMLDSDKKAYKWNGTNINDSSRESLPNGWFRLSVEYPIPATISEDDQFSSHLWCIKRGFIMIRNYKIRIYSKKSN